VNDIEILYIFTNYTEIISQKGNSYENQ